MSTRRKRRPLGDANDLNLSAAAKKSKGPDGDQLDLPKSGILVGLLSDCGLELRPRPPHALTTELKPMLKKLTNEFQMDVGYPEKVDRFGRELVDFLSSSDEALASCLAPMAWESADATSNYRKESPVRALLQLPELQKKMLDWLLEKMVFVAMDEEEGRRPRAPPAGGLPLSGLILSQIRWMSRVADGKGLADKVVEVLEAAPWTLQLDLVPALPDIVEERFHCRVAMVLRDLMKGKVDLIGACLDAFSCLSVTDDIMEEIRASVTKRIANTAREDLPGVVKFLLDSCPEGEEEAMAASLREQVDFSSSEMMSQITQRSRKVRKNEQTKDVDVVLVHLIQDAVTCNRKAATAWFRAVEHVNTARFLKPLDILILLMLHKIPNRKKNVESLVKNKIRSGVISEQVIQATFSSHPNVVKIFLENVTALTTVLGMSAEPVLAHHSLVWRREAFLNLDRACQQEVFSDIVYKISSYGLAAARTSALKTLVHLAKEHTEETLRYGAFVEGILDYVFALDLSEYRQIMDVLSLLAYSSRDPANTLQDNIHIVIKKQVAASKNPRLVRMGVTGAVVTIKNMTSSRGHDETLASVPATQAPGTSASATSPKSSSSNLENAGNLLRRVLAKSRTSGEVGGLLMDELANVIEGPGLDERLKKFVAAKMTGSFQGNYVLDLDEDGSLKDVDEDAVVVPVGVSYKLDGDTDIALNLAPMVGSRERRKALKDKADMLLPEFRLLKASVASTTEDLEDIDALLGCPVAMPTDVNLEKFEVLATEERNVVCSSLFYCANWFRELLNAFAEQEDCRKRVLARLKHLLRVTKDLRNCLDEHPTYVPPSVIPIADLSAWQPPGAKKSAAATAGKGKGKKRKGDDTMKATQTQVTKNHSGLDEGQRGDPFSGLEHYQPFFRELDLQTFSILSYDKVTIASEPPEEEEMADPKLRPPELALLLADLHSKLSHVLVSSKGKKSFPEAAGKANLKAVAFSRLEEHTPAEVAKFAVGLLDYLLGDLEEIAAYHKRMMDANDGILDSPGMFNEHTAAVCTSQERVFLCLATLLSWNGFGSKEQSPLLKEALATVGRRINEKVSPARSPRSELAEAAFAHLERCWATVLHAGGAAAHLRLLAALLPFVEAERRCARAAADVARRYLKRDWRDFYGDKDKGARFNSQVETMLRTVFLAGGDSVMPRLASYVTDEMPAILEVRNGASERFPTFTRSTLPLHFRIFFEQLIAHVKTLTFSSQGCDPDQLLESWSSAIQVLQRLVSVLKVNSARALVATVLRHSNGFMESFLRHGMPVLDRLFKRKRAECIQMLRDVQTSTRLLQHACSFSKTSKDPSLTKFVPALKRSLEAFVYRVKGMLALNDAVNVFKLGILKNRDLQGHELLDDSTTTAPTSATGGSEGGSSNADEEEDALPEEDESDVDDVDGEEETAEDGGSNASLDF